MLKPRVFLLPALALLALVASTPAHAWYHGGWGWRGGIYIAPPPVFVGPPVVYASPPIVYAPPPPVYYSAPAGQACYAGAYVCPLERATPVGAGCSCPTNTGRAFGQTR
jgi:hypothetical protein